MASVIQTLGPNAYSGFMELIGDGQDACTHKALVCFADTSGPVDSYVKIYCARTAPKGFVNELIGYSLAKWGGLLTPPRAAVLLLDVDQTKFLPPAIDPMRTNNGKILAWCVQSLAGTTPKQSYNLNADKTASTKYIRQDLNKWKDLPNVVALDAWLLNEDRNLGNVVRVGEGQYAVIDHGRVCTGNSWESPLDKNRMNHTNLLAAIAWENPNVEYAPENFHAPLIGSFVRYKQAVIDATPDLDYWLPKLISIVDEQDAKKFYGRANKYS